MQIPKLIAHRGASEYAPENTLVALRKAHELGASWVEFDVMLTADDQVLVFHDPKLDRTTNGTGEVMKKSLREIKTLDAGAWFAMKFKGEMVPTLAEWLKCAADFGMGLNIELKVRGKRRARRLVERVFTELDLYWDDTLPAPLLSSFYRDCLIAVRELNAEVSLGFLTDKWRPQLLTVADRFTCVSFHMNYKYWTPERVEQVKASGKKVLAYTVNDIDLAERLFAMGVDAIFTNDPLLLNRSSTVL